MSRKRSLAFFKFIVLFILLPLSASGDGTRNASDAFFGEKCFDTQADEDKYAVTRMVDDESCMLINDVEDIPQKMRGTQSFGEPCDGTTKKCKLYVRSTADCLKPTHLVCDPGKRVCACSASGQVVPAIRFQFGTDDVHAKMNITHGRCLIRPSFEVIAGVDCSPGSKYTRVGAEIIICGCQQESKDAEESEVFMNVNTTDSNWWYCQTEDE